jgi:VanZ family protein
MSKALRIVLGWLPALLMMLTIFMISAQDSSHLPNFHWADRLVKKGGHMIGYALLVLSYWRVLDFRQEKWWLAWCLAILYAVTDEYHQSFVAGRFPSIWDVLVYDNLGALISLGLFSLYKTQRSDSPGPIVESVNLKSS